MRALLLAILLLLSGPLAAGEIAVDLFVAPDCPIARSYSPEIERLHQTYLDRGVKFRLVFPDRDLGEDEVRRHLGEFGLTVPFVIDRNHAFVKRAKATATPEAVVFDAEGQIVYRGRIDDRYTAYGKRLSAATEHYLRDALEAVLSGRKPVVTETTPIGCLIEDDGGGEAAVKGR